jgi:L-ascorbate metabolism protein UlaG (beta-lactamase superfamily)
MKQFFSTVVALMLVLLMTVPSPAQDKAPTEKEMAAMKTFAEKNIHWLGHDSFKIVGTKKTIYVDPFKLSQGDKADIVCVTHAHFDHCSPEDIAKLQTDQTVVVAPADSEAKIKGKVLVIHPGEKLEIDGVTIEAVPAYNTNKKYHPKASGWMGYIITLDGVRIYHAGDTDRIPEMKDVQADVALVPVSGTYVMTADEAAEAVLDVKPAVAIPMHYGSIVGKEADAQRLAELLKGKVEVVIKTKQ